METHTSERTMENKQQLEKLVKENFERWNDALKTRNPEEVVKLYAENAVLVPTLSHVRVGMEEIKDYFEHDFLPKHPTGEIVTMNAKFAGDNFYIVSGDYDFQVGPESVRHVVKARYTFFYEKNKEGIWEIAQHHSSKDPQPEPASN